MRKLTVSELRENALQRFIENNHVTDERNIRKAVNAYYRLCAMDETLLYWENDERIANKLFVREYALKRDRAIERVSDYLNAFGLSLKYFGYTPTIVYSGTTNTAIEKYFYE